VSLALAAFAGFLLGAIVGSFLATLVLRWPEGRDVGGRSVCDGCGRTLGVRDLFPLASAALSRGRARCCGRKIDPLHWQVELASALLGGLSFAAAGGVPEGAVLAFFGWLLLPLVLLDARHYWLPDRLLLLLALAGAGLGGLLSGESLLSRLLAALVGGGGLMLLAFAYRRLRGREGLGSGDPKMLAALGLWLGPALTVASLLLAALMGLAEALARRRAMDEARPLGTLLGLAAWIVAASSLVA
jgi:leader peptidase (prepilin peptidase) / N-methyltransferase